MSKRWKQFWVTVSVLFLLYAIRYNPEFTASAARSGWFFVRAFADSLGRVLQAL